jgi:uncharacterized phosphosugar-binding protein
MPNPSRRKALKSAAAAILGVTAMSQKPLRAAAAPAGPAKAPETPSSTFGHTRPFAEEYQEGSLAIFEAIKRTELPAIAALADRMAGALKAGSIVWMQAKQGHMPRFEFDEANKGNPRLLRSNSDWDDSDYDKMRPGDVLVTNYVNENVARVKKAGVYVVEVTVCYQDRPENPRGWVKSSPIGLTQADLADVIIESHTPMEQGLVSCPEIPEMKICPSSSNALAALFWMMQAEAANRVKNPSTTGADKAAAVIDALIDRTRSTYAAEKDAIFGCAAEIAKRIAAGAHYHVTSDHGGVQCDATGVASGPMMTNAFRKEMKAGDVYLLTQIEPDSKVIADEAKKAHDMGLYVVGIGPAGATELRARSDAFLDNHSGEGGGLVEIPGCAERVATVGGIINNILAWTLTAQFVDALTRLGRIPWFWMGFYLEGGGEYDEAVKRFFLRQGF